MHLTSYLLNVAENNLHRMITAMPEEVEEMREITLDVMLHFGINWYPSTAQFAELGHRKINAAICARVGKENIGHILGILTKEEYQRTAITNAARRKFVLEVRAARHKPAPIRKTFIVIGRSSNVDKYRRMVSNGYKILAVRYPSANIGAALQ